MKKPKTRIPRPLHVVIAVGVLCAGVLLWDLREDRGILFDQAEPEQAAPAAPAAPPVEKTAVEPTDQDLVKTATDDLVAIVDRQDPRAALEELASRVKTQPAVFKYCHLIAHEIGHESYKKYHDFLKALTYQESICSDGYLHGVIEERLRGTLDVTSVLSDLRKVCDGYRHDAGRCYHGVGHGLMYYTSNDLPKALALCDKFSGSARGRCDEGVFMENFISDDEYHPTQYRRDDDSFFPCADQYARQKPYCYFYAPIHYLDRHDDDYASALAWCMTAENKTGTIACVRGVGSLAMKYDIDKPKEVEAACATAAKDMVPYCIDGMVSYHLTFTGNAAKTRAMCDSLDPANRPACVRSLDKRTRVFVN